MRDDFKIYLDGKKLEPSKAGKGQLKKWVIGKDIEKLPKPAPDDLDSREDREPTAEPETRYGWDHKDLGRHHWLC